MRDQFAAKTRTIIIDGYDFSNMTLMNQLPPLLRWLTATESIQISQLDCGLDLSHPDHGKADRGKTLLNALRGMKHIKHIELTASPSNYNVWPQVGGRTFEL